MSTTQKIQLAIRATPERVWDALTDPEITPADFDPAAGTTTRSVR